MKPAAAGDTYKREEKMTSTFLTGQIGIALLVAFTVFMGLAIFLFARKPDTDARGFLVANREVGLIPGAMSVAVTFIWAPAVFVVSLQAFQNGVPGLFWFLAPNLLTFIVFALVARKVRNDHPEGFTLTQFVLEKTNSRLAHIALLTTFFLWLLTAIVINGVAGGFLLSTVSGVDFRVAVIWLSVLALTYSLSRGMRASIITDVLQMTMVIGLALIMVPWTINATGGTETLIDGLGGMIGNRNPLDPKIAYEVGILATIGLLGGTLQDQMFYQRAYSVKKHLVFRVFFIGAFLFAFVPLILSSLGFIGASLVGSGAIEVTNPEMVGPIVIANYLPSWALALFVMMAFAGLTSTLDSAFVAMSSLTSVDVYQQYINRTPTESQSLRAARYGMFLLGGLGIGVAFLKPDLFWVFRFYAAVAAGGFIPTLIVLFAARIKRPAFLALAVVAALAIALPTSVIGNMEENIDLIVGGTFAAMIVSFLVTWIGGGVEWKKSAEAASKD